MAKEARVGLLRLGVGFSFRCDQSTKEELVSCSFANVLEALDMIWYGARAVGIQAITNLFDKCV